MKTFLVQRAPVLLLLVGSIVSSAFAQANYRKEVVNIPMRDGVTLNTEIYYPAEPSGPLPLLITRTPYGLRHDKDGIHTSVTTAYKYMAEDQYIFVFQDIR